MQLLIDDLETYDGSLDAATGCVNLTCNVGDGWQQVDHVDLVTYDDDGMTLRSLGSAECRLGAHRGGSL